MQNIPSNVISKAMDYNAYRALINDLYEDGKATGPNQSEAMLHYTHLNIARMKRLDKTTKLSEETLQALKNIKEQQTWLVLTEGWCGDAAQVVPVLNKMAEAQPLIQLRFILRDENLEIMDAFLTNGGRSIPKVIITKGDDNEVKNAWGPRPKELQDLVFVSKAERAKLTDPEAIKTHTEQEKYDVQKWYAKDKTRSIQHSIISAL